MGQEAVEEEEMEEGVPALASYDVQSLFLKSTEGMVDGSLAEQYGASSTLSDASAAAVAPVAASAAAAGDATTTTAVAAALAPAVDTTNNPWFFFANHPALQVEGTPKTDKIYMATPTVEACSVCGLRSAESPAAGDNIDGPGAGSCRVDDACGPKEADGASGSGSGGGVAAVLEGQPEFARMWVTDRGAPMPNTTIATVFLKAAFTPGRADGGTGDFTTVSSAQVAAALNATIQALGLPTRFHLRAERAASGETVDPAFQGPDVPEYMKAGPGEPARRRLREMRAAQRRRLQEQMAAVGELEGQQECGRSELFKAYIVSDWKNVTDAVARGVRSAEAEGILTRLLQQRADADAAEGRSPLAFPDDNAGASAPGTASAATPPAVCTLVAYRTASMHIPANPIAGVSNGACACACVVSLIAGAVWIAWVADSGDSLLD